MSTESTVVFYETESLGDFTVRNLSKYGITVVEFAKILGVSRRGVYDQFDDPKDWFIQCLATFFWCDVDALRKRYPSKDSVRTERLRELGRKYRGEVVAT